MACGGLDTRGWNLAVGVVALVSAGCGRAPISENEGPADNETGGVTDGPGTATDGAPECSGAVPCPGTTDDSPTTDGVDSSSGSDAACRYYEYDGFEEYCPEECIEDSDCDVRQLCLQSHAGHPFYCSPVTGIEHCYGPGIFTPIDAEPGPDEVISLHFVDADGDPESDLVVGYQGGGAAIVRASSAAPAPLPLDSTAEVIDVAAGDFTGDAVPDLVVAQSDGTLAVLDGDGMGDFVPTEILGGFSQSLEIEALQFNSDDALDLAVRDGDDAFVMLNLGDGTLMQAVTLETSRGGTAYSLAVGRNLVGSGLDDVVISRPMAEEAYAGTDATGSIDPANEATPLRPARGERFIHVFDLDGDGEATLFASTEFPGWTLLEGIRQSKGRKRRSLSYGARIVGSGQFREKELLDVVLLASDRLIWVEPGPEDDAYLAHCQGDRVLDVAPIAAAVGDWDGNGLDDVAYTEGSTLTVLTAPSQ